MTHESARPRWSHLATGFLWFAIGFALIAATQILIGFMMIAGDGGAVPDDAVEKIFLDGDLLSYSFVVAAPIMAALAANVAVQRGRTVSEFLALRRVSTGALLRWLVLSAVIMIIGHVTGSLLGRPTVPDWFVELYPTIDNLWLFAFSLIIFGPLLEEILFRGLIIRFWLESPLSHTGVIVLSSLLWTAIHTQYDMFDAFWVFVLGVMLGYSRLSTRSVLTPLVIHAGWNTVAVAQLIVIMG